MTKSNATKQAIGDSLHKLLQHKTLDEITVKELVEDCGISRQTFYYHFQDIYGVVEWRFQQISKQFVDHMEEDATVESVDLLLKLMKDNKVLLLNIYRAFDRSYLNHYLTQWTKPVISGIIGQRAKEYNIEPDALDFIEDLFVFGLVNILLNWMDRGMAGGAVQRLDYFYKLLEGSLDDTLRRFSK